MSASVVWARAGAAANPETTSASSAVARRFMGFNSWAGVEILVPALLRRRTNHRRDLLRPSERRAARSCAHLVEPGGPFWVRRRGWERWEDEKIDPSDLCGPGPRRPRPGSPRSRGTRRRPGLGGHHLVPD